MDNSLIQMTSESVLLRARSLLKNLCDEKNIDSSHNELHTDRVLFNMDQALKHSKLQISEQRKLSMRLASLLHDASDRKYFENEANDQQIMIKSLQFYTQEGLVILFPFAGQIIQEALEMISYVSAAKNGNKINEKCLKHPEFLYARHCDRLESLGRVGIARCYLYNINKTNRPLAVSSTPKPKNVDEVWQYASIEKFEQYQITGSSVSMLDHYYDKLLRVANFDPQTTQNDWLVEESQKRLQPMIDLCIKYGEKGEIPIDLLDECAKEYENSPCLY